MSVSQEKLPAQRFRSNQWMHLCHDQRHITHAEDAETRARDLLRELGGARQLVATEPVGATAQTGICESSGNQLALFT